MSIDYDQNKFVDRETEIKLILDKVEALATGQHLNTSERVLHLMETSGAGKSWLLEEINKRLEKNSKINCNYITFKEVKSDFLPSILEKVSENIKATLAYSPAILTDPEISVVERQSWIYNTMNSTQNEKVYIFLLDDIELLDSEKVDILEDFVLARILSLPNTVIVLAGRKTIAHWKNFDLRPGIGPICSILPFSIEDSIDQLKKQFPNKDLPVEKIHSITMGNPGLNALIAASVYNTDISEFNMRKAIQICTKTIQENLSADIYKALTALSVFTSFCEEEMELILKAYTGESWNYGKCRELLKTLLQPFENLGLLVHWGNERRGYIMDEQVRRLLELELKHENKSMWQTLHCEAYLMYQKWGKDTSSKLYGKAAEYHETQLMNNGVNTNQCKSIAE